MSAVIPPAIAEEFNGSGIKTVVVDSVAPGTEKKLSLKEYKNLMRQYFTVRRPIVQGCGHKIDVDDLDGPGNNCESCWFAFFNNHGELVKTVAEMIQKHGSETVVRMRGVKFLKMFRSFMSTLAAWKARSLSESFAQPTD